MQLRDVIRRRRRRSRRAAAPRRRARARLRAPDRPRDRRRRARSEAGELPAVESFQQPRGPRRRGRGRGPRGRRRPAEPARRAGPCSCPPSSTRRARGAEAQGQTVDRRGLGRTACAACSIVADTAKAVERRRPSPRSTALGLRPVLLTGDNADDRRAPSPPRSASTRSSPTSCPPTRPTSSGVCRTRAASWRWSATASTTRPRSRRPTSASPSAPAPTSRSRPPTSRSSRATCSASADAIRLSRRTLRDHQGQPLLGLRLQRRRPAAGRRRLAQPAHRRRRDGVLQPLRRRQLPAAPPLPATP